MAAAISQDSNEARDRAGGVLSMELKSPTREHLHINALARLGAEMGQEFLTQRHLALASHGERSAEGGWCLGRGSGLRRCLSLHHAQRNSAWHPNRCALRSALQLVELFAEH